MSRRRNPYANDPGTRAAKQQGYPARSVFKLDEIDKRVNLLRSGQRVLDLGAAPGSWSMYASQKVGPKGAVLAIDLQPMLQQFLPNVRVIQGDVRELALELGHDEQPFDVVLSDMAPSTTGNKIADQTGSFELYMTALEVAARLGKPGSSFVAKLFMGPDFESAKRAVTAAYAEAKTIRPRGTRQNSSEVFVVGLKRR
ncbi:MAG TPA: RlmE family RNA methyltransferase [Polyangiaceae bacterium]|nr:RlmE family RNA methyltransferase [Polyangiaceae bacterium]